MELRQEKLFSNKQLVRLFVPLMLEQGLGFLVGMVDGIMASSVSEVAMSGVSLVNNISHVVLSLFTALSTGGAVVISQHIGAKRHGEAKKSASRISLACFAMCMTLGLIVAIFGKQLSLLYTTDVGLAETCSILLWMMLVYQATGSLINTNDPALKVGGNQKFVMVQSAVCVWGIRLPLTWLLAYVLDI